MPSVSEPGVAVVTGASSGIGAATARHLAKAGFRVICAARRTERVAALAAEIGGVAVTCDVTSADDVAALAAAAGPHVAVLVNNAGGAIGVDSVATASADDWRLMYETNVVGAEQVTQALLPALIAAHGAIVFVTSTAAESAYEGGAGYCGVKSAERALAKALRLELWDKPVRVTEIAPGMVHTPEFSLVRFAGDQAKADAVYAGVPNPLVADDIAEAITWMATRPEHVAIESMVVRPVAQAANHKVFRGEYA